MGNKVNLNMTDEIYLGFTVNIIYISIKLSTITNVQKHVNLLDEINL